MAYVTVPKDLTKVKSKVLFGLTRRQLVCFGTAALIGVPLFFLLRRTVNSSTATVCMIVVMLPLFLLAMYEKNGQPLEVIAGQIIQTVFLRPKERPYMTDNFYAAVERQSSKGTYNNKTYEYTHRYGAILTSATSVDEKGNLIDIQKGFETSSSDIATIKEPRIYFGLETNDTDRKSVV